MPDFAMAYARLATGLRTTPGLLIVAGCVLFAVSVLLPVMRWSQNEAHATSGSAKVFLGSGYSLVDGGFGGEALLAVALAAAAVLAVVTAIGAWTWWVQLGVAVVAAYYPVWVAVVFARKWEDDVDPAIGVAALVVAFGLIAAGLWLSRPRRALA